MNQQIYNLKSQEDDDDLLGKLAEEQNKDVTGKGEEQAPEAEEYTTE